jgi:FRG domain.
MKLEDITREALTTVAELIDLNEKLNTVPNVNGKTWAFRGQPRDYGTLAPSFQRQFSRRSAGAAEIIEQRLIQAFREHYAKLKDRSVDMPIPSRIRSGFDLRCLSVMQHYEIPTRLLDWSSNFWTSVYFACASEPGVNAELWYYHRSIFFNEQNNNGELNSLLDANESVPIEPALLTSRDMNMVFELDPRITPRMKEQFGHHTVSTNVFADHAPLLYGLMKSLEFQVLEGQPIFGRVIIDGSCKGRALQFLAEEKNITASTIFPDVVGLGRFLRWQFESLKTMLM